MYLILILTILLLFVWAGIQTARLASYQKQARHMLQELQIASRSKTRILFTSALPAGNMAQIVTLWNDLMKENHLAIEQLLKENRSYRESITSISHDIRTPLTSAKGYLQLLCHTELPEQKRQEYTQTAKQRLDALAQMLDQLFFYTRIEAGELPLTIEPINAANLFAEIISMFYTDFLHKGCEPDVQLPKTPCQIPADRQAFTRIVENLIKNALVHGTGDYQMSLSTEGSCAVIRMANRTDSIEESDLACIFDRFYTTDMSRSRRSTGLGLAIVKELTRQLDGTVSAALDGDLFSITLRLPLLTPDSNASAQPPG